MKRRWSHDSEEVVEWETEMERRKRKQRRMHGE